MNKYVRVLLIFFLIIFTGCSISSYNRLKYLDILESFPKYKNDEIKNTPNFTYATSSDTNFIKLKEKFNLKKIAGNGDEISKIINLMKWVHNIVYYDGSSANPSPRNTPNIIKVCQMENRGINCRMKATILNEVYLSMGFKSRFVTCKPAKKDFRDCHVINIVYSSTLDKWVYMDPTFEAYFRDENSNFLSIQEVRERLMNDQPLIVNDEPNFNPPNVILRSILKLGMAKYSRDDYLDYMAKNLFRFSCPVHSEFQTEKKDSDGSYIELIPTDYHIENNPKIDIYDDHKNTTYFISNPDIFWKRP